MARVVVETSAAKVMLEYHLLGNHAQGYQIEVVRTRIDREVSERIWADRIEVEELIRTMKRGTMYPQDISNIVTDFNVNR